MGDLGSQPLLPTQGRTHSAQQQIQGRSKRREFVPYGTEGKPMFRVVLAPVARFASHPADGRERRPDQPPTADAARSHDQQPQQQHPQQGVAFGLLEWQARQGDHHGPGHITDEEGSSQDPGALAHVLGDLDADGGDGRSLGYGVLGACRSTGTDHGSVLGIEDPDPRIQHAVLRRVHDAQTATLDRERRDDRIGARGEHRVRGALEVAGQDDVHDARQDGHGQRDAGQDDQDEAAGHPSSR